MAFYVGQKVVAIVEWPRYLVLAYPVMSFPNKGTIYTIRAIEDVEGDTGLLLNELKNPIWETTVGVKESSFISEAFRPLTSTKTDISIFTSMLGPKLKEPA